MLVLSRKENESVILVTEEGIAVVVTINSVIGGKVKLGITAPRSITVDRAEVHAAKQKDKEVKNGIESNMPDSTS